MTMMFCEQIIFVDEYRYPVVRNQDHRHDQQTTIILIYIIRLRLAHIFVGLLETIQIDQINAVYLLRLNLPPQNGYWLGRKRHSVDFI